MKKKLDIKNILSKINNIRRKTNISTCVTLKKRILLLTQRDLT